MNKGRTRSLKPLFASLTMLCPPGLPASAAANHSQHLCSTRNCSEHKSPLLWFQVEPKPTAVWAPFGTSHTGSQRFEKWLAVSSNHHEFPKFTNSLSLNCWEFVVYGALKNKWMNVDQAKRIYEEKKSGRALSQSFGLAVGRAKYKIQDSKVKIQWPTDLEGHDVVFMDESGHVVQLLGQMDNKGRQLVVSFSPRPIWGDGSQERPVVGITPEVTTVESLIEEMMELYPDVPTDWNQIDLFVVRISKKETP